MPFKSKAQQRFMFSAEERGDLPKGTAKRWAKHTKSIKKLPEHVKKAAQGFTYGFGKTAGADYTKLLRSAKPLVGSTDAALARYNAGIISKMKNKAAIIDKTGSAILADDTLSTSYLGMQDFVPGSSLRANAETGQIKGKSYRTPGVQNEGKEFKKSLKQKGETARGGTNTGGTPNEMFSADGNQGQIIPRK